MKKVILSLVLVIIIGLAGGVYYLLTNLNSIIEAAIEKYGSEATQTTVSVDKVDIKIKEGSGGIYGLTVANTKGFDFKHAFSLGEIKTGIQYESLKQEPYVISEAIVRAPQIFVEINKDKKNNLNELKKNLLPAGSKGKQTTSTTDSKSAPPRLIIKKLVFENGDIQAKVVPLNNKEYKLKMPSLNMTNLGGKNGATPTELASEILDRLIDQVKKQIKQEGIDAEVDKLKTKAKAKVDEEKAKLKEEADTKLDEEKQKAEEKLKGLLN